ncbi:MAG: hypothetical protein MH204_11175 [Fimbriimonadaceae bacterium]|nr:hypothetical protein [Fimbriimonadaceae bacterium]
MDARVWPALAALLALASCGPPAEIREASRILDREYARAEALGVPLTAADLDPGPIPQGQNSAGEVVQLLTEWIARRRSAPDAERPALDERKLAELGRLLERPRFVIRRNHATGPALQIPEYALFNSAARILDFRIQGDLRRGRFDRVLRNLRTLRRLAWAAGQEPLMTSGLVADRINRQAVQLSAAAAWSRRSSRDDLLKLRVAIAESPFPADIRRWLQSEPFFAATVSRNMELFGGVRGAKSLLGNASDGRRSPSPDPAELAMNDAPADPLSRALLARHLEFWNRVFEEPSGDPGPLRKVIQEFKPETPEVEELGRSPAERPLVALTAWQRGAGEELLLQAGIEVLLVRAERGRLPETLAGLSGRFADPYGGQLQYEVREEVFCIWSPGDDGRSQGGFFGPVFIRPGIQMDDVWLTFPPPLETSGPRPQFGSASVEAMGPERGGR